MSEHDTIAAISTPLGEGGIGIVKISGSKAKNIIKKIFQASTSPKALFSVPKKLYHGFILSAEEEEVDEVLVSFMPAPYTYTKEDIVEINCHSGVFALRKVLLLVLQSGARLAEPGEFTKRAFLSGRIDLGQAEAVMNIIRARSEEAVKIAARVLKGELSARIEKIGLIIVETRAPIEAGLDYPEEFDETDLDLAKVEEGVRRAEEEVLALLKGVESSRAYQEGVSVAILGKQNVGKSSLLNALLRQNKAIVHEVPGTTRDVLEGFMNIGGYPVRLLDTAGIGQAKDPVEIEGISRSKMAAREAQLIIYVLDGSFPWQEDEDIAPLLTTKQGLVLVINKIDLDQQLDREFLENKYPQAALVETSALQERGIDALEEAVAEELDRLMDRGPEPSMIVSLRQEETLKEVLSVFKNIKEILNTEPLEIISSELQYASDLLGSLTGATFDESLLDKVFSEFCLGK